MNSINCARIMKAKAIFTCLLVLSLHVVMGCGTAASSSLSSRAEFIPLTPDHPMSAALSGSMFQGASGIEVDHASGRFRVIFPDPSREISGVLSIIDGKAEVRQLSMVHSGQVLTILFNEAHQITTMVGSNGEVWHRSADSPAASRVLSDDQNPYMAANADLVEQARQFHASGGSQGTTSDDSTGGSTNTGSTGVKVSAQLAMAPFLFFFVFLPVGAFGSIIFILELAGIITLVT